VPPRRPPSASTAKSEDGLLLAGMMVQATGTLRAGQSWRGQSDIPDKYAKAAAQKLMQEGSRLVPNKKVTVTEDTGRRH